MSDDSPDKRDDELTSDPWNRQEHIAEILVVLSYVVEGQRNARLDPQSLEDGNPFQGLFAVVNDMVEAIESEEDRRQRYRRELEERIELIEQQRNAIRELSTPVIEVGEGTLCLPVIGVLDEARSADVTDALMQAVVAKRAHHCIVDVTGIEVMDSATVQHLARLAQGVRLLGSACVITGLSPEVAVTLASLGPEIQGLETRRTLREALAEAERHRRTAKRV